MTFHSHRLLLGAGAAVIALSTAATAIVSAQNTSNQNTNASQPPFRGRGLGGPGGLPGPGGPLNFLLGRAAQRLGLTDAQQSQIKAIADAHKSEVQTLLKQVGDARRALLTAQVNGQPDSQIVQLSAAVAQAESQMALAQAHVIAELMQVLTPDQQNQVRQLVAPGGPRGARGGGRR
jgi:Spy/CpxP family protein refolding chaperone